MCRQRGRLCQLACHLAPCLSVSFLHTPNIVSTITLQQAPVHCYKSLDKPTNSNNGKGTCGSHRRLNILSAQLHGQIIRKGLALNERADCGLLVSIDKQSEGDTDRSPPAALPSRIKTRDFNERGIHTQCGCNGPNNAVQIVLRYISVEHLQASAKQPRTDTRKKSFGLPRRTGGKLSSLDLKLLSHD